MWSVFLFGSSRHYIKNSAQWEYYHFTFQQSAQNWRPEMYKDFLPSLVIKWRIHFTTTALIIRIANIQRHLAARRALWQENFSPLHSIVKSLWAFSLFYNCWFVVILWPMNLVKSLTSCYFHFSQLWDNWPRDSPVRYVLKIHFFIESGRKMIQFKTKSKIFIQKIFIQ